MKRQLEIFTSLTAAWRTDHAYPNYLRSAAIGDVVINPSLRTDRADDLVRHAPGVVRATSDDLLTATLDDGTPRTGIALDGSAYCWGKNSSGQLGNGTIVSSSVPVKVGTLIFK